MGTLVEGIQMIRVECHCREHERQERADNGDRAEHREPEEGLQLHQERPRTRRAKEEEGACPNYYINGCLR